MIYLDYEAATGGDPYWSGVALLVQDGADGTLVIQDRSSFADSVTIANYAEWDSAQQVFGANQILCSTNVADIPDFSDADGSRFGRAPGEPYTIETWVNFNSVPTGSTAIITDILGPEYINFVLENNNWKSQFCTRFFYSYY